MFEEIRFFILCKKQEIVKGGYKNFGAFQNKINITTTFLAKLLIG